MNDEELKAYDAKRQDAFEAVDTILSDTDMSIVADWLRAEADHLDAHNEKLSARTARDMARYLDGV